MLIFIVLAYFCVACSALWLALFPSGRDLLAQGLRALGRQVGQAGCGLQQAGWGRASGVAQAFWTRWRRVGACLARHWAIVAGVTLVILVPSMVAMVLAKRPMLPAVDSQAWTPDPHVAELLKGERLAPPVTLPPLAFSTQEVETVRPMLVDASRNWTLLHPDFSQRLLLAFKIMREQHGYEMALLEGYRSPERQNLLAGMGSNVTNAGAFQSYHQYGLAADCAFWRDGKLVISEKDPWAMQGYRLYGEVAESVGLTWGGRWTMMDFGHTELRLKGVIKR